MTPSEQLVGRRLPRGASYQDQLLAGYLRCDGSPCGRMTPGDRWLMAPHKSLRKDRLITSGVSVSIMGGRPVTIWHLTEKGLAEARLAVERVKKAKDERQAWSRDLLAAHRRERDKSKDAENFESPSP